MAEVAAKRRHLASLDLLRVSAMLYIVGFWHLMNYAGTSDFYRNAVTTRITIILLAAFTMLSGYLLGLRPVTAEPAALADFYRRRLLRIYPPFVAALVLFALVGITDWPTAWRSMVFASEIVGPPPVTLWYVGMLGFFYLITPLLTAPAAPRQRASMAVIVMLTLLALALWQGLGTDPRIALYFPSFAIGLMLARQTAPPRAAPFLVAALGLAGIPLTLGIPVPQLEFALPAAPMATFLALALLLFALRAADHVPPLPAFAALGSASYVIYLVHRPIYELVAGLHLPEEPALRIPFLIVVVLPFTILAGLAGQKAYDRLLGRLGLS